MNKYYKTIHSMKVYSFLLAVSLCTNAMCGMFGIGGNKQEPQAAAVAQAPGKSSDHQKIVAPAAPAAAGHISSGVPGDFCQVVEHILNSTVSISVISVPDEPRRRGFDKGDEGDDDKFPSRNPFDEMLREFFKGFSDREQRPSKALGSGFVVKKDKDNIYIGTNYHVVKDAKKITITLKDKTELQGTLFASDHRTDLAILKVSLSGLSKEKLNHINNFCIPVDWADSDQSQTGEWVLAVGNPFGLGNSVTAGIISAKGRDLMIGGRERFSGYEDFIQHSAAINMGNSGGVLINAKTGKVVGVNVAILTPSGGNIGIGFAIPSNLVKRTVNQLVDFQKTQSGWLGVRIQQMNDDFAQSYGVPSEYKFGSLVVEVTKDSPADKAGVKTEDVIIKYNNILLNENEKNKLTHLVRDTQSKTVVPLIVLRSVNGKMTEVALNVQIGEFDSSSDKDQDKGTRRGTDVKALGWLEIADLSNDMKKELESAGESTIGVYVSRVNKSHSAYLDQEASLEPRDIIQYARINGSKIELNNTSTMIDAIAKAKALKANSIVCFVLRKDISLRGEKNDKFVSRFVVVKIGEEASAKGIG